MDYLITGGNGFIGTNLVNFLINKGKTFEIIDLASRDDVISICQDVCVRINSFEHNTLVHLAAETNVRLSIEEPRHVFSRNCNSILNCLNLLKDRCFKRLIFTSSSSSSIASSPYLASKLSCEAICKAYRDSYGLNISILKLSNVYGPHSIHKSSVIPRFIKACLDRKYLTIFGDGSQTRDFVHVSDVVNAIYNNGSGHISSGIATSIKELASTISNISWELTRFTPRINYEQVIQGEVKGVSPITNISPKVALYDGLYSTFKWFMENYNYEH